jgi:hypothetical protein
MSRSGIQVPPLLLHILAVIALVAGQPERAFLSGSRRARSRDRSRSTSAAIDRRRLPARLHPTETRGYGHGHAESTPTPNRPRCSPLAPNPTGALTRRGPTTSNARTRHSRDRQSLTTKRRIRFTVEVREREGARGWREAPRAPTLCVDVAGCFLRGSGSALVRFVGRVGIGMMIAAGSLACSFGCCD